MKRRGHRSAAVFAAVDHPLFAQSGDGTGLLSSKTVHGGARPCCQWCAYASVLFSLVHEKDFFLIFPNVSTFCKASYPKRSRPRKSVFRSLSRQAQKHCFVYKIALLFATACKSAVLMRSCVQAIVLGPGISSTRKEGFNCSVEVQWLREFPDSSLALLRLRR